MSKIITTLLLVLALVGYIGFTSPRAATSNTREATNQESNGAMIVLAVSADVESLGSTNTFGVDEAHNGARALGNGNRDMDRNFHFGAGERWSPYPPYYRSEQ